MQQYGKLALELQGERWRFDLIERRLLVAKSRAEVLEIHRKPNDGAVPTPSFPEFTMQ